MWNSGDGGAEPDRDRIKLSTDDRSNDSNNCDDHADYDDDVIRANLISHILGAYLASRVRRSICWRLPLQLIVNNNNVPFDITLSSNVGHLYTL